MVDIKKLKPEILKRLIPLKPDKIILFGSYAYGTPSEDSDIDLFLLKDDLTIEETRQYQREARKRLRDIIFKYDTNGIDILSAPTQYINQSKDYFHKIDILQNGIVWYEQNRS
ncbi:MAG: nucleotidyltransferase domain-containing protein [Campylobacterota bacterium]|nr:nucleotidyltransferase domain-containing protein [Campylobacterota bacterium]